MDDLSDTGPDGRSLAPALSGASVPPRIHPFETVAPALGYGTTPVFGLLGEDEHTYYGLPRPEYYDLSRDPGQLQNLYEGGSASVDGLQSRFNDWDWNWPPQDGASTIEVNSGARRQLEALGYVAGAAPIAATGTEPDPKDLIDVARFITQDAELVTPERALERAAALEARFGSVMAVDRFRIKTFQKLGRSLDAVEVLAAMADRYPEDERLRDELEAYRGFLDQQRMLANAIRQALAETPDHPTAERDLALVLHRLQDLEAATELYRRVLAENPDLDDVRANLGRALASQGLHVEALNALEPGLSRQGHDVGLDCLAGRLLAHYAGQVDEARSALTACRDAGRPLDTIDLAVLDGR